MLPGVTSIVETKLSVALLPAIASMRENPFLNDIQAPLSPVQYRIHGDIACDGARDRAEDESEAVIKLHNDPLATELVCAQRHWRYSWRHQS